jgi:hypothetical protein
MDTEPQRDLEKEVNDLRHELRSFYPILMKMADALKLIASRM